MNYTIQTHEQEFVGDAHCLVIVALHDGMVVGSCRLPGWEEECPTLTDLFVIPEHRRRGVATAIIMESLNKTKAANKRALSLCVKKANESAERLYRKLGFRQWSDSKESRWLSVPMESDA